MSTRPRWLWPGALAAALLAVVLLVRALGGGTPQGPASSSYATDAEGLAAWAALLERNGHRVVQLRTPIAQSRLDPADTVVVLDPEALLHADGERLLAFVGAGGLLVAGGAAPQGSLPALLPEAPAWSGPGVARRFTPAPGAAGLAGVREVQSAGAGEWTQQSGFSVALGSAGGGALLLERAYGRGRIELLADASPLQDRLLASADNALFGLDAAGTPGRTVFFAESVHGFGPARGLAAIPARWWLAFALLALAGALWALARGRRLGPAEPSDSPAPPPRSAYLDATALVLRRTHEPEQLARALTRLRDAR